VDDFDEDLECTGVDALEALEQEPVEPVVKVVEALDSERLRADPDDESGDAFDEISGHFLALRASWGKSCLRCFPKEEQDEVHLRAGIDVDLA